MEYNFPMNLSVPEDIYVGFSAEGDGWDAQLIDSSALANTVSNGYESGVGFYWWGSVAGGQLVQGQDFSSHDYFKLKVEMIQPVIVDFSSDTEEARMEVAQISEYATYQVERSFSLVFNTWETAGEFTTNTATGIWSEPVDPGWGNVNYRIKTKAVP